MKNLYIIILVICYGHSYASTAVDIIKRSRPATALNRVILYEDSLHTSNPMTYYYEGDLFEVIAETQVEHEDSDQKHKYKWYMVKTHDDATGWVFGDGLAVVVPDYQLDRQLRDFNKKEINFSKGFEEAIMWIGVLKGKDNFHLEDHLNPRYSETYLVITNKNGYSMHVNLSSENEEATHALRKIQMHDLTGDGTKEIILENESTMTNDETSNIHVSVYSMQSGLLNTIFEERTSLMDQSGGATPAIAKYVDIDGDIMRVEYMDFIKCEDYSLSINTGVRGVNEYCMEHVTYSYKWNNRRKVFDDLFEESRTTPKAKAKFGMSVRSRPTFGGKIVGQLQPNEIFKVVKQYEKSVLKNGQKKTETYLYIQMKNGAAGYILANHAIFINSFHAPMIIKYYNCKNTNARNQICTNKPDSFLGVRN